MPLILIREAVKISMAVISALRGILIKILSLRKLNKNKIDEFCGLKLNNVLIIKKLKSLILNFTL